MLYIKLYNFSMLINMSIVVLQIPDTLHRHMHLS